MGLFSRLTGKRPGTSKKDTVTPPAHLHRGVEVRPKSRQCCQAVQALAGRRYRCNDAPLLPLANCDAANCRCAYQHYDDRRTDTRRDADLGLNYNNHFLTEENRNDTVSDRRS